MHFFENSDHVKLNGDYSRCSKGENKKGIKLVYRVPLSRLYKYNKREFKIISNNKELTRHKLRRITDWVNKDSERIILYLN